MILRAANAMCLALLLQDSALGQSPAGLEGSNQETVLPVKFAVYSSAWNVRGDAGMRIVAQNQSTGTVRLTQIVFQADDESTAHTHLQLDLDVPAASWAEREMRYVDLLSGNECVRDTMNDDWKLVEISNYPLNPSVRGLIIEDTQSFRIYQCVRLAVVHWKDLLSSEQIETTEWLMYHFERRTRP